MVADGASLPTANAAPIWLLLAVIGLVLLFVNLVVQYGLARVVANRAIVIMISELGFAALASWWLAGELLGLREWMGGATIVAAAVLSAKMERAETAS